MSDQRTRVWFDTEFIEDGKTIELLSIGLVNEHGETYYAEPMETDRSRAGEWVKKHVLPKMDGPVKPRERIRDEILTFAGPRPEFWAFFASYDWVALCQLFGTMMDLPSGWPMFCRDIQQERKRMGVVDLPTMASFEQHNALADALWCRDAWIHLDGVTTGRTIDRTTVMVPVTERLPNWYVDLVLYDGGKNRWVMGYSRPIINKKQLSGVEFVVDEKVVKTITHWAPTPKRPIKVPQELEDGAGTG